jgi:hypothetical protein
MISAQENEGGAELRKRERFRASVQLTIHLLKTLLSTAENADSWAVLDKLTEFNITSKGPFSIGVRWQKTTQRRRRIAEDNPITFLDRARTPTKNGQDATEAPCTCRVH